MVVASGEALSGNLLVTSFGTHDIETTCIIPAEKLGTKGEGWLSYVLIDDTLPVLASVWGDG